MATTTEIRVKLFDPQDRFLLSTASYVLYHGGRGAGKSHAGALKAIRYVLEYPGSRGIVVNHTTQQLKEATNATLRRLLPHSLIRQSYRSPYLHDFLRNGSEILYFSAEDPEMFRGFEAAWVWADEAAQCRKESIDHLDGCLRQPDYPHQMWFSTTPRGRNWLWEKFYGPEHDEARTAAFRGSPRNNPFLPPDYVPRLEESYGIDSRLARQEIEGEFIGFEELVYPDFDSRDHVQVFGGSPKRTIAGVDWGFRNPWVIVVGGLDADERLWLMEEYYERQVTLDVVIKAALDLKLRYGIDAFFCDGSSPANVAAFRRAGLNAWPITLNRPDAKQAMIQRVAMRLLQQRDGTHGLYVHPRCKHTIGQFLTYHHADARPERPVAQMPLKVDDDCMDAVGHLVEGLERYRGVLKPIPFSWVSG